MSDEAARREKLSKLVSTLPADRLEPAIQALEHISAGGRVNLDTPGSAKPDPGLPQDLPSRPHVAREPARPAGKPDVRVLVTNAVTALKGARWAEALDLLDQALAVDPELREQLTPFRATAYMRTGFPDLAAKAVARCRPEKLSTRDALILAKVMREAKVYESSEALLTRIIEKEPGQKEAAELLAKVRRDNQADSDPVVTLAQRKLAPMITDISLLARGGMAIVCKGYHTRLKQDVAVKVLHPDYLNVPGALDRFLLEAITLINLGSKYLVEAYAIKRGAGFESYYMELLVGAISTEHSVRTKGAFAWTEGLKYLVAATDALVVCHKRHIVHRDVKPDNILILPDGRVKLIDLGAADFGGSGTKHTGDLFTGTLRYSAPEVLMRKNLGPPADVYSLAVTFHDLVMGMSHDTSVPPDPTTFPDEARDNLRTKGVGRMFLNILHKALDPDPRKRHEDAQALREDLAKLPVAVAALPKKVEVGPRVDDATSEPAKESAPGS